MILILRFVLVYLFLRERQIKSSKKRRRISELRCDIVGKGGRYRNKFRYTKSPETTSLSKEH